MKTVKVFLLDKNGDVQYGLNWGQRDNRDPNQAYLQLTPDIYRGDFFPPKGKYFVVETDDNKTFIMTRAQKEMGTALQIPDNNALLGEYLRKRLGVPSGNPITKEDILNFGLSEITFHKNDDMHFLMSFGDFTPKQLRNNNIELLSNEDLIDKVRKSFTHFVHLVNTHTNDFTGYIAKFEEFTNPRLTSAFPEYTNIFQIVDIDVLHSVVAKLKELDPSLEKVFTEDYSGTQYHAFRTMKYYEMYLDILADSDFRSNIDKNKEDRLAVVSANIDSSQNNYLRAMRTKPFLLLAGISGTGKSRIVNQMAFDSCPDELNLRKDPTSPGNYCLIEVKPNWHDSSELLGYESKIGGDHYILTPFVKFLAKAMLYPEVPFFVCLDEMNLAPVEQYFAEFLSVLESRTKIDGHIVSEPLIKADIFSNENYTVKLQNELFGLELKEHLSDDKTKLIKISQLSEEHQKVYDILQKNGLRIPENVVIIGTVNMDETTHQFSRKVIDRAMTIEMNLPEGTDEEGNEINPFKAFFNNSSELSYREEPTSPSLYLATETRAADVINKLSKFNSEQTEILKENVTEFLTGLNTQLEGTPFKVAYRVQNELILYFYQLVSESPNSDWGDLFITSADQILMMKVLPRIEVDEELLEKPLERLILFSEPYPNASKKVLEMQARLKQSRFTSFWP